MGELVLPHGHTQAQHFLPRIWLLAYANHIHTESAIFVANDELYELVMVGQERVSWTQHLRTHTETDI